MEDLTKQDINGKDSAKRKWASRLLWVSIISFLLYGILILSIGAFTYLRMEDKADFKVVELLTPYLKEMWIWIMVGGFGSLGLTIFEFLNNFFKK